VTCEVRDIVGYQYAVAGRRPDKGHARSSVVDDLFAGGVHEWTGVVLALVAVAVAVAVKTIAGSCSNV
jgi:hypothetical protein